MQSECSTPDGINGKRALTVLAHQGKDGECSTPDGINGKRATCPARLVFGIANVLNA